MIAISDSGPFAGAGRLALGINITCLGLLAFGITTEIQPGLGGRHLAELLLLVIAVASWLGWQVSRARADKHLTIASLVAMGLAGGALSAFAPLGLVFVAVAALGATIALRLSRAAWVVATGPLAMLLSVAAVGHGLESVLTGLAAALAGTVMGVSRRQSQERTEQAALVQVSEARAEAERARAELLAGRNHMARELHDILAHTLSALSLQLQALDALVSTGPETTPAIVDQLGRINRLVREGLDEARGAVQALREDSLPLEEQLARLAGERGVELQVVGSPRRLAPDVSLALYRVAQEALTNVVKHAPGATAEVKLGFDDGQVTLSVANECCDRGRGTPLSDTGGGYGLQGIEERVLLIGGHVDAGPTDSGWLVEAQVPA